MLTFLRVRPTSRRCNYERSPRYWLVGSIVALLVGGYLIFLSNRTVRARMQKWQGAFVGAFAGCTVGLFPGSFAEFANIDTGFVTIGGRGFSGLAIAGGGLG